MINFMSFASSNWRTIGLNSKHVSIPLSNMVVKNNNTTMKLQRMYFYSSSKMRIIASGHWQCRTVQATSATLYITVPS